MKSWKGQSCRKMVRHLEIERSAALEGVAIGRNGDVAPKGVLPRPLEEIDSELATWCSRLAGPELKQAPEVPSSVTPSCRTCSKKLRPVFELVTKKVETNAGSHVVEEPGELRGFGHDGRGHFCSLTCGWKFAVNVIEKRS